MTEEAILVQAHDPANSLYWTIEHFMDAHADHYERVTGQPHWFYLERDLDEPIDGGWRVSR